MAIVWILLTLGLLSSVLWLGTALGRATRRLQLLERRIAALEVDNAATVVIEPPPPRLPHQLPN